MEIIEGKCEFMCPERERLWREKHDLLHRFEIVPDTQSQKKKKADPDRAVKQYSRPAAGRNLSNPQDLRPLPVLQKTVQFLIESIMARRDEKWIDIYDFCSDRLRSVCQDITIQRISGPISSWILESAVRFYIYSDYRLFDTTSVRLFDATINGTLLMDCLKRVLACDTSSAAARCGESPSQMAAVYVLYNLNSQEALLYALGLDASLRSDQLLRDAIRIGSAYHLNDYLFVLRSMRTLPPLLACCLHRHLQHLRKQLLLRLSHGFSSKLCRFPIGRLSDWLQLPDAREVTALCNFYGLAVDADGVVFLKSSFLRQKGEFARCHDARLDRRLADPDTPDLISVGGPR